MTRVAAKAELERPALRWERANGSPVDYPVWPERPVTIGREPTNMIAIDSPFVSKAHAIFQYTGGQYVVEDLGSSNGTRVNGAAIESAVVELGDVIEIGDERLLFVDRTAEDPAAGRQPLSKNLKLALAAGGTLTVLMLLFGLLIMSAPAANDGRTTTANRPNLPAASAPVQRPLESESQLVRDVVQRAEGAGVNPVDALMDEAMVEYRVGRLREASELFTAAASRDPRNELARGRLQATDAQLARAIDQHRAGAERASSQLRFDDAVNEWEQVLMLTDAKDPRHAQAESGLQRARAHR